MNYGIRPDEGERFLSQGSRVRIRALWPSARDLPQILVALQEEPLWMGWDAFIE